MKILKIDDASKYNMGLEYLKNKIPKSYHALSNYSGISYINTIRMLTFDLCNKKIVTELKNEQLQRIVAISDNEKVLGIGLLLDIPEFCEHLDYEQYIIIVSEDAIIFNQLYITLNCSLSRFELITFREEERIFVSSCVRIDKCVKIHNWRIYEIKGKNHELLLKNITVDEIPEFECPANRIETHPGRYIAYIENNIQNVLVFALPDSDDFPIVICSCIHYYGNVMELKVYFGKVIEINHIKRIVEFLETIAYFLNSDGKKLVWRVKEMFPYINQILQASDFECISEEKHLHFDLNL